MLKMYCLVLYNLSPIQQGIQSAHAIIEYINAYGFIEGAMTPLATWMQEDKTIIILNGGTSQTLDQHMDQLNKMDIKGAAFREPDLYDKITAVAFLAEDGSAVTKYFTPLFKLA